ncbi:hypothetical protein GMOD_00008293 [Pyrenophora seminiperda CCB06]|uniref:Uncharacterized protein n=1 Tax=Pyrenophora seminiperda CCB06 TaxID=1302712 RepID=A0A3M7M267_9PLEO|nr:hypothetical protein GMOD_00008293 [Pyrenophora seminiperda CCB06]
MNLGMFCFSFKVCPDMQETSSPARPVPRPILPRAIKTPTGHRSSQGSLKSDSTLALAVREKEEGWGLHQEDLDMHQAASDGTPSPGSHGTSTDDLRRNDGTSKSSLPKSYQCDVYAEWERRYEQKYGTGHR